VDLGRKEWMLGSGATSTASVSLPFPSQIGEVTTRPDVFRRKRSVHDWRSCFRGNC
jgi:hypothetical protein